MIDRLADMLEAEGLIASDTAQTVKADLGSSPYARASQLMGPAIDCVHRDQQKLEILVTVLTCKHFKISLC